jgi:hypothetical protein
MSRTISYLLLLLISTTAYGQFNVNPVENIPTDDYKKFNWGYYLGGNSYNFKFNYSENYPTNSGGGYESVQVETSNGFLVGLVGELRLNDYFDLRFEPGLYSAKRDLYFPIDPSSGDPLRSVKSTFLNFPFLVKYGAKRIGNWRPFVIAGPSLSYNMSSNQNSPDNIESGVFRLKSLTYNYEIGVGVEFYLPYFKFTPSIRGVFGLVDEMVHDNGPNSNFSEIRNYSDQITSALTRGFFIVLTFE